jgi:hypothetical protein
LSGKEKNHKKSEKPGEWAAGAFSLSAFFISRVLPVFLSMRLSYTGYGKKAANGV